MHNLITTTNIHQHQSTDQSLQLKQQTNPIEFPMKIISNMSIICHIKDQQQPSQWKIVLPTNLLRPVIHWYHLTLQHAGADRMYDTIRARFECTGLQRECKAYRCGAC